MSQPNLQRIIIAGGQVTGWTVAAGLANSLAGTGTQIVLIDLPEHGDMGLVASTFPQNPSFHHHLGIDESDLLRKTYGTFKLGTRYEHWHSTRPDYFHVYGGVGATLGIVRFHQFVLKLRAGGEDTDYNDYSVAAAAARLGRFSLPVDEPQSVLAQLAYAVQLDSELYVKYLREYALQRGVTVVTATIERISVRGSDGFIDALELDSGDRMEGDFFVDCSGTRGLLIDGALGVPFDDWSEWLPCDNAIAVVTGKARMTDPYTRCVAEDNGWLQRISLQHATVNEFVYSSQYLDELGARETLESSLAGYALSPYCRRSFRSGLRQRIWDRNCVAFGQAAGGLGPLETTALQLLHGGLVRFLGMLPDRSGNARLADEYNRIMRRRFESARDFVLLRYRLSDVAGAAFWRHAGFRRVTPSLRHRIDLFRSRGRLADDEYDVFPPESWVSLMLGNGLTPSGYDPLADAIDAGRISAELARIRAAIRDAAEALPSHHAFITQRCAATLD